MKIKVEKMEKLKIINEKIKEFTEIVNSCGSMQDFINKKLGRKKL
jgi:hypothetical protein